MTEYKNKKIQILLPVIITVSIAVGILISRLFFSAPVIRNITNFYGNDKLNMVINYVESEYVDEVDRSELEEMAIPKFLEALDPHTTYSSAEDTKRMTEELEGNFEGIGVQFNIFKDTVFVVKVIEGGPSERSGVFAGDRIVKVNDSLIAGIGINNDRVMKLLKGPRNSKVNIEVSRRGSKELIPISINRGNILTSSIDGYYITDNNTGYIKISSFSRNTYIEFVDAVTRMKNKGITSLVVDLRNNTGGYMTAATNMLDEFLKAGEMIVYTEGRARPRKDFLATNEKKSFLDLKLVVLIDDFSASASEIFAGAIQDNDRGFIIGRRSFGKGLVQEATTFSDGSMIRLTTSRYYTPSGRSIQKPYDTGLDNYYSDIYNRYAHGEFMEKDSINFNDSLTYYTSLGRKVYGGGGIMPDIFVPIDTAGYSKLYGEINRKNLSYYYSLEYVDNNRSRLLSINSLNELKAFMKNDNAYEQFWNYVKRNDVIIDPNDLNISKVYIENNFAAYVARQVLGENEFYEVVNRFDPALDSALNVIRTDRMLVD